jgi:hypothetical protein
VAVLQGANRDTIGKSLTRVALSIDLVAAVLLLWVDLMDHKVVATPDWVVSPWSVINIPATFICAAIPVSILGMAVCPRSHLAKFSGMLAMSMLFVSFMLAPF